MIIEGIELKVTPSSFELAMRLQGVIAKTIQESELVIDVKSDKDKENDDKVGVDISGESIGTILKTVLMLATSKEIRDVLFECSKRALYGDEKVDKEFFEKEENRKLFFPIMIEVAKANISPFFESLASMFPGISEIITSTLKQK